MPEAARVAIIGASGYTGAELCRLIAGHPRMRIASVSAKRAAGQRLVDVFPHLRGVGGLDLAVDGFDPDRVAAEADVAFSALPHGEAAVVVAALRSRGVRVLDLSADFRLREHATWKQWYGGEHDHAAAALLADAVYGLPERHRSALRGAGLVAVPGCYPTATVLAIAPLLERGLVKSSGLVVDAKSGASGVGRTPGLASHFPEMAEGLKPYKVGGTHRHTPEIEQELARAAGVDVTVLFTPHLVPMVRGILACVYAEPTDPVRDPDSYRRALADAYADEPFVDVLPAGAVPDTAHVRGSNRVHVTAVFDPRSRRVLAMSAIDNLVKGASGQALQCANLVLDLPETMGLAAAPLFP